MAVHDNNKQLVDFLASGAVLTGRYRKKKKMNSINVGGELFFSLSLDRTPPIINLHVEFCFVVEWDESS